MTYIASYYIVISMKKADIHKILRLTPIEKKVLNVFKKHSSILISDISTFSKLPRMTIYPALSSLKERGLIDYTRKGKRKYWFKESEDTIAHRLTEIASSMSKNIVEVRKDDSGFIIHRSLKSIYTIFERIAALNPGERLRGIQPTASMVNVIHNLKWEKELKPIQDAIREKGIVVEAVLQEDYYTTLYKEIYKDNPRRAKEHIQSFIGRATDMAYVTTNYLNANTELMMFRKVAFIVNWKDEVAIEIYNKDMLEFLTKLYELARGYGKKVDQNQYLKEFLEKQKVLATK